MPDGFGILPTPEHQVRGYARWWEAVPDGLGKGNAYTRTAGERLCQMVWVKVMPTQEQQVRGCARWFG